MTTPLPPHRAFLSERPWQFAFGHVFPLKGDIVLQGPELPENEIGYWRCDIAKNDRLSWTAATYHLFDLPLTAEVARNEVVGRYSAGSMAVLERVRAFSIGNSCGFLLDARMSASASGARNLRILSVPLVHEGRVVAIHGLKRAL
jgi:hypothetical protein